jgi:hypothetical protein
LIKYETPTSQWQNIQRKPLGCETLKKKKTV